MRKKIIDSSGQSLSLSLSSQASDFHCRVGAEPLSLQSLLPLHLGFLRTRVPHQNLHSKHAQHGMSFKNTVEDSEHD